MILNDLLILFNHSQLGRCEQSMTKKNLVGTKVGNFRTLSLAQRFCFFLFLESFGYPTKEQPCSPITAQLTRRRANSDEVKKKMTDRSSAAGETRKRACQFPLHANLLLFLWLELYGYLHREPLGRAVAVKIGTNNYVAVALDGI